jgi:hypothetical protein
MCELMFGNLHCINYIFLERYKYALRCTVGILEFLYMKAAQPCFYFAVLQSHYGS